MPDDDFIHFERAVHDRLASSYRDLFEPVTALAADALLATAGVLPGGRHADLACGSGIVALGAQAKGAMVEAFDLSDAMISILRERAPAIRCEVASVDRLPVEDHCFDTATMSFGIGHLPKPEAAMAELSRVLKPGGRVALSWWADREDNRINGLFVDVIEELALAAPADVLPPGPPIFRLSHPKALVALCQEAGFVDICLETLAFRHTVSSALDWWQIGLGAFARVSTILNAQTVPVRRAAQAIFLERAETYRRDGGIAIPIEFHVVSASTPATGTS